MANRPFVAVTAGLAAGDSRCHVIVTSGPSERGAAARVIAESRARLAPSERRRVLDFGELSLTELRAVLNDAAIYIGGDSGPLHVAATSPVPIVGLYGPTLPARSAPWRGEAYPAEAVEVPDLPCRPCDQRQCEPGDFRCLTRITPEQVLEAARRVMSRKMSRMSQAAVTVASPDLGASARLEQAGLLAVFGVGAALQFSIATAQSLLAVALLCWVSLIVMRRERIEVPRFFWPLVVYAGLTLVSAAFSPQPWVSFADTKQLVLFLLVPLTFRFIRGERGSTMITVIVTAGAISAAYGIFQYGILHYDIHHRARNARSLHDVLRPRDAGPVDRPGAAAL